MKNKRKLLWILIGTGAILLLLLVFSIAFLSSHTAALKPTLLPSTTFTISPSPAISLIDTLQITELPSPTPTQTQTPVEIQTSTMPAIPSGFLVYSQADGLYYHLFAASSDQPYAVKISNPNWDEINPAINPDGAKIAFGSKRSGFWDIYVLDLVTGNEIQVTNTSEYDGHPTWSSDGQWLAYESYVNGKLSIFIRSFADLNAAPIRLTDDNSDNFSPAWAPAPGREIAFVSNRTGDDEIWIAHLDQVENRFVSLSQSQVSSDTDPAFSPNGKTISWTSSTNDSKNIVLYDLESKQKREAGFGEQSSWKKDTASLLTVIDEPNSTVIAEYQAPKSQDISAFFPVVSTIQGIQWIPPSESSPLREYLSKFSGSLPTQPAVLQVTENPGTRSAVVSLDKVNAPYPYLIGETIKSYSDLRGQTGQLCGWDFLANLESAYLPLSEPPSPGMGENWLLTGRAIQVNSLPLEAGWMAVAREDFNGQTFWRLYLKALKQDGSQGMPLSEDVWNFDTRYSGDAAAYENGGSFATPPSGYWVDFTELALRNGWKRLPALSSWRAYYPAARFNIFVNSADLDWRAAMDLLYPPEAMQTFTPFPTATP